MDNRYRSYVVRVWSRDDPPAACRALIEEIQSGQQAELRGDRAASLAAILAGAMPPAALDPVDIAGVEPVLVESQKEIAMILVVGATGLLGDQIARGLLDKGYPVRILVRPSSNFVGLAAAGAVPVIGDLKEPASLAIACDGIDTIVTTATTTQRAGDDTVEAVDLGGYASLIEAARAAGVRHFIYTSVLDPEPMAFVPFVGAKIATEARLRASGMAWTILAPDAFMDVWLAAVVAGPALAGQEVVYVGGGERVHSFIHSRDVAAFAVASVGYPAARNRHLRLGGPAAVSLKETVEIFEQVLGRPIAQHGVAPGEPLPGMPPLMAALLANLDTFETRLEMAGLAAEFGVRMTSVEDWARSLVPVAVG